MSPVPSLAVILVSTLLAGCTRRDVPFQLRARPLEAPAAAGSGEPNLTALPDGRVLLSWIEEAGEGQHVLRYALRSRGSAWSKPETIASGQRWFVNWADFPSVGALPDGTLFAHWLEKRGAGKYAYDVRVTTSRDGGRTWSEPVTPHRDGTESEHGFVSMAPMAGNSMGLVWLDGRKTAGGNHGDHDAAAETSLIYSTLDREGRLGPETVLDGRVCDCCQTDAAVAEGATVVVYRDRSGEEVRDISVVRLVNGTWTEPRPLARDGWEINGCPVNGPALAAAGRKIAAAWFAAPQGEAHVRIAFSGDSGATFGAPIGVDDGHPLGRVDVVLRADGQAVVGWLEQAGKGAELRVRRVSPDGTRSEELKVADTSSARASGFPRMAVSGDELVLAWREIAEPPRVRTAVVTWSGLD